MTCTPTRLELSNTDTTIVEVTITSDPGDGTAVVLSVPGLGINESENTASASVAYSLDARTENSNSLWDGTIQVGANAPADIVVQIVETSSDQSVGLTITDDAVSYCAPSSPAAGLEGLVDVEWGLYEQPAPANFDTLRYNASSGKWSNQFPKQSGIYTDQGIGLNNNDVTIFGYGGGPYPLNGQTLTWSTELLQWTNLLLTIDADQITSGTVDNARLSLAIDDLSDCAVDKTANNILYTNGSVVRSRSASNWSLSQFTNDLPAVADSYVMMIEAPSNKTYYLDPKVVVGRTITSFYARTSAGTCTAWLKQGGLSVGLIAVTSSGGTSTITNASVSANAVIQVDISSTSSAEDLQIMVGYTQ